MHTIYIYVFLPHSAPANSTGPMRCRTASTPAIWTAGGAASSSSTPAIRTGWRCSAAPSTGRTGTTSPSFDRRCRAPAAQRQRRQLRRLGQRSSCTAPARPPSRRRFGRDCAVRWTCARCRDAGSRAMRIRAPRRMAAVRICACSGDDRSCAPVRMCRMVGRAEVVRKWHEREF